MTVRRYVRIGVAVAAVGVLGAGAAALAHDNGRSFKERLSGYQEVPALSTEGFGTFRASLNADGTALNYRLTFGGFTTNVRFAHIHFENRTNNGPVIVFLCSNEAAPAGTPACPAAGGTVTGTLDAADVGAFGAAAQGIAPGEFDEFVDALRSGATYVNVHTVERGGGEIRAQIEDDHGDDD
jgi:CHRD domain